MYVTETRTKKLIFYFTLKTKIALSMSSNKKKKIRSKSITKKIII